ncbi:hypothetical protein HYX12_03405 [Candidatus Woesearchaeota archaeon]|nr:hypothetical protein [Candidatus Woesearchaeota archaeon]
MVSRRTLEEEIRWLKRYYNHEAGVMDFYVKGRVLELLRDAGYHDDHRTRKGTIIHQRNGRDRRLLVERNIFSLQSGYSRIVFPNDAEAKSFLQRYESVERGPPKSPANPTTYMVKGGLVGAAISAGLYLIADVSDWKLLIAPIVLGGLAFIEGKYQEVNHCSKLDDYKSLRDHLIAESINRTTHN